MEVGTKKSRPVSTKDNRPVNLTLYVGISTEVYTCLNSISEDILTIIGDIAMLLPIKCTAWDHFLYHQNISTFNKSLYSRVS